VEGVGATRRGEAQKALIPIKICKKIVPFARPFGIPPPKRRRRVSWPEGSRVAAGAQHGAISEPRRTATAHRAGTPKNKKSKTLNINFSAKTVSFSKCWIIKA
jgi:hypothetical protein